MASEFTIKRSVEFSDTDMAGIVHFSNFFKYMEACEHAFVRSLGLSIVSKETNPTIGWPRVAVSCEFKRALRFEDEVEIHLKVAEKSSKAITYSFAFRKVGEKEECARGSFTVVCCTFREGRMQATFIPAEFNERIEVAGG